LAAACGLVLATGCGSGEQAEEAAPAEPVALPFERIAEAAEDPADNGPDDELMLEAIKGGLGPVKFKHFSHASNKQGGFGIDCAECHHTTKAGELADEGCVDCHEVFTWGADPGDNGPEDNLVLIGDEQDLAKIEPAPFNHFTHASAKGYKLSCETCHHTGDLVACTDCHGKLAKRDEDGNVVPKGKRAFHLKCLGCHEALAQNQPDTPAPIGCKDCHKVGLAKQLGGHLTYNRALHRSCIGCHLGVAAARPETVAPTRECAGCHYGVGAFKPGEGVAFAEAEAKRVAEEQARAEAAAAAAAAGDGGVAVADKGPEIVPFTLGTQGKTTKPLTHIKHQEYGPCSDCHHKGLEDPKCSNCHKPEESKDIFHQQCKDGCHKVKGGPTGCKDCH
jgi:hypothetical protein